MKTHRSPAVAGMFYPNNPKQLTRDVNKYLSAAKKTGERKVKFLIVPHAGYMYSGRVAGAGFSEATENDYEHVIVLGPSHRYSFKGLAESEANVWDLPNGSARIKAIDKPAVLKSSRYHEDEHCLEVQFPFLLHLFPTALYSPILLSGPYQQASRLADLLLDLDDSNTLWVISSDFNHVGPGFHHFPRNFGYGSGEAMDRQAIDHIVAGDIEGLVAFLEKTHATICGALPILTAMHLIKQMKLPEFTFKSYDCSGNQTGDQNSVGYAALFS